MAFDECVLQFVGSILEQVAQDLMLSLSGSWKERGGVSLKEINK